MRTLAFVLLVVCPLSLLAQAPYLVKDINTTFSANPGSSSPADFATLGNNVFFTATTSDAGNELWASDGTSAGTRLFDLVPGAAGSSPSDLEAVNGVVIFNARDVNHGAELWVSNGTAAGTHLLLDINPGPNSSLPLSKFLYNNRVLFSANDGVNGRELWISDGTAAGTRMLKDLSPGSVSSSPSNFVLFNNRVYFFAAGALWKTDGTAGGTVQVATVTGREMIVAGSRLFFEGYTVDAGWEPWVSDGTDGGTRMIADILPGFKGSLDASNLQPAAAIAGGVVFLANDGVHGRELWTSDFTAAGTRMVRDFTPGPKGTWDTSVNYLTALNGRAFFSAADDQHGAELWVTDGTDAGTQLFLDLVPGPDSSYPSSYMVDGGNLYFVAGPTASHGFWVTDGTVAGTHRLLGDALGIGYQATFVVDTTFWPAGGRVYFGGYNHLTGEEPWVTDGTDAGTHMIANVAADSTPSSNPNNLVAAGNLLFFYAIDGLASFQSSLWRSDGTAAGTFKLRDNGLNPGALFSLGSGVVFQPEVNGPAVLTSDGTVAGTQASGQLSGSLAGGQITATYRNGNALFMVMAQKNSSRTTLWTTTTAPNAPWVPLGLTNPMAFVDVAGREMFVAGGPSGQGNPALWISDGTAAGTVAVVPDLGAADFAYAPSLANAGGTVYFVKQVRGETTKLWKSDGTFEGTVVVKELPGDLGFTDVKAAGRRVFFTNNGSLWTSDGTEVGTVAVSAIKTTDDVFTNMLQPVGNRVIFGQHDLATGTHEIWTSDGTPQGTKMLQRLDKNILARPAGIDGVGYFAGFDDAHGMELWSTDGTPEGTKLLADLNPGPASSYPYNFTKAGNLLYFSATTDATGAELWALPLTEPRLSIGDTRVAEGGTARFTVTLSPAAAQSVSVDYATSDGTAKAGDDYDAASGTLTFAPGETSKTIDVRVRGDAVVEGNETFYVALRNAQAAVSRGEGFAIIEDDDHAADVSVVPQFIAQAATFDDAVAVANAGPSGATDIVVTITSTPAYGRTSCVVCAVPQVAAGATATAAEDAWPPQVQTYLSAVATSRTPDPRPSNNVTSWTLGDHRGMAMVPAFLVTGGTGTIAMPVFQPSAPLTSSDPSVVAVGTATTSGNVITMPVTALKPGTSTIAAAGASLLVTVVAPGTTPRWPGAVSMSNGGFTSTRIDQPYTITVTPGGTAPFNGARATGTVVVTADGQEVARRDLGGGAAPQTIQFYFPRIADVVLRVSYAGDANFLPQSFDSHVFVLPGKATLNATLQAVPGAAGTFALTVIATGAPAFAPGGTLSVLDGTTEIAKVPLVAGDGGSTAHATLTNLPASPALTVNYPGDLHYVAGSQQVRVVAPRPRAAHH